MIRASTSASCSADEYYDQSKYVCVMQRTWNGSTVTIAVNLDREWEYDIKLDGEFRLTDSLCASDGDAVSLKGGNLHHIEIAVIGCQTLMRRDDMPLWQASSRSEEMAVN